MYDFTGCQCPVCHRIFKEEDVLVVCPDCGAPYHRACYEQQGQCSYSAMHGAAFEWQPPKAAAEREIACANCGAMNDAKNSYCKSCGAPMPAKGGEPQYSATENRERTHSRRPDENDPRRNNDRQGFDYEEIYHARQAGSATPPSVDPNETMEGIPAAEWASYIGPSSWSYLHVFKQMELLQKKVSPSFSALLFGPYYFFYRKAWKPALIVFAATVVLNIPAYLWLMVLTGSSLASGFDQGVVTNLLYGASVLSLILRVLCGLFGFYFYKKDSARRIRKIRTQFDDPQKRAFVLSAQGGTSILAVVLAFGAMYLISGMFSFLMGPNLDALYALLSF